MLNQGYSQTWGQSNIPEAILEARPEYRGSWTVSYMRRDENGVEEHLFITYAPVDSSGKGHWSGKILDADISVVDLMSGKPVTFKRMGNMINMLTRFNSDKKQNNIIKQAYKNRKSDLAKNIMVSDSPNAKSINITF